MVIEVFRESPTNLSRCPWPPWSTVWGQCYKLW